MRKLLLLLTGFLLLVQPVQAADVGVNATAPAGCGDGSCNFAETCTNCPQDCSCPASVVDGGSPRAAANATPSESVTPSITQPQEETTGTAEEVPSGMSEAQEVLQDAAAAIDAARAEGRDVSEAEGLLEAARRAYEAGDWATATRLAERAAAAAGAAPPAEEPAAGIQLGIWLGALVPLAALVVALALRRAAGRRRSGPRR